MYIFKGGTQLKTLDVKTVEVKVEPPSTKSGDSLNTSTTSISSNDGKMSLLAAENWKDSTKFIYSKIMNFFFKKNLYQIKIIFYLFCDQRIIVLIISYSTVDKDEDGDSLNILGEKDVTPVGMYFSFG